MDEDRFSFRAEEFENEASFRWPEQFAESQRRISSLSKPEAKKLQELGDWVNENLVRCQLAGYEPHSDEVQVVVEQHFRWVSAFWDPDKEAYMGLSDMYIHDKRYQAFYERINPGLSEYLSLAMKTYANSKL